MSKQSESLLSARNRRVNDIAVMIGAKSVLPGFGKKSSKLPATVEPKQQAKALPKEKDAAVKSEPDPTVAVSLHTYMGIPKGQKLTKADLDKAEKKAKKEGNDAILSRIKGVRRFVEKKTTPGQEGKKTKGFALYRGLIKSPKASKFPSKDCICVGWGGLDYYYLPVGRLSLPGLDKKLRVAFETNPTAAGVLVNTLAREKKIAIYLRYDVANKRPHIPATAVTAAASFVYTDREINIGQVYAALNIWADNKLSLQLNVKRGAASDNEVTMLINISDEHASELVASGAICLMKLRESLYNFGLSKGLYRGSAVDMGECGTPEIEPPVDGYAFEANDLRKAFEDYVAEEDSFDAEPVVGSAQGTVSPTKMTKSSNSRTISGQAFTINLSLADWMLVQSVISDKLQKALVSSHEWIVSTDEHNVRFKSSKPGITVVVNADLLLHKLK